MLLRGCRDALVMAFSTGSSTVTMPVTFECLRKRVGLREKSASLGALVGANFNNDGTALYEAMAALFVSQMLAAQGLGVELTHRPAAHGGADVGRGLGRRRRHSRGGPRHDDPGVSRRRICRSSTSRCCCPSTGFSTAAARRST